MQLSLCDSSRSPPMVSEWSSVGVGNRSRRSGHPSSSSSSSNQRRHLFWSLIHTKGAAAPHEVQRFFGCHHRRKRHPSQWGVEAEGRSKLRCLWKNRKRRRRRLIGSDTFVCCRLFLRFLLPLHPFHSVLKSPPRWVTCD